MKKTTSTTSTTTTTTSTTAKPTTTSTTTTSLGCASEGTTCKAPGQVRISSFSAVSFVSYLSLPLHLSLSPLQMDRDCCSSLECQQLIGGSNHVCRRPSNTPTCVGDNQKCGGAGQQTLPCCSEEFDCGPILGGTDLTCQRRKTT